MKKILREALGLNHTVIENVTFAKDSIIVLVRPYERYKRKCLHCGRTLPAYDHSPSPRRWRALDLDSTKGYLESSMERVPCPEHGVITAMVPWARHGYDMFEDSGHFYTISTQLVTLPPHSKTSFHIAS